MNLSKDYSSIFNILISCLEEQNFLIYSEALKIVNFLAKIFSKNFPSIFLKHSLHSVCEKYKASKSKGFN